jgi:hypothetical protein
MNRRTNRTKKAGHTNRTGQMGVNLVEGMVIDMGFTWNPTYQDSGIDGTIEIVDPATRDASNRIIQVQVKAVANEFSANGPEYLSFYCDPADIDYWRGGNSPVILIVCRPSTGEAYWKDIKGYFNDPKNQKTNTVRFDKETDRFDKSSGPQLANLAKPEGGLYLGPFPKSENLISNLFPLEKIPQTIWSGVSKHRGHDEFREALKKLPPTSRHLRELMHSGGTVYSFHDLKKEPLSSLVEAGTVEANPSEHWALTDDPDLKRNFVQLLNRCLRQHCHQWKMNFNGDKSLHYFQWEAKTGVRKITLKSLRKQATQTVGQWRASNIREGEGYFSHKGFRSDFIRFGDIWYLQVSPDYFFSSDGHTEHKYAETLLSGIKTMERHQSVRSSLLLWREVLSEKDLTKSYDLIKFGHPVEFKIHTGINDRAWLRTGETIIESDEDLDNGNDEPKESEDPNQTMLPW